MTRKTPSPSETPKAIDPLPPDYVGLFTDFRMRTLELAEQLRNEPGVQQLPVQRGARLCREGFDILIAEATRITPQE